nr:Uma2 family endonuclease [Petrachloros mirabilis]
MNRVHWTTRDLALFADNDKRYEIIDGALIVTRAPRWSHQQITGRIFSALDCWSQESGLGEAAFAPGILLSDEDNVIPDVAWASHARLHQLLNEAEHLVGAPELIVEVLSPGEQNVQRDCQLKLKLYSQQGVQEYWIVDPELHQVQVYRRDQAMLKQVATLFATDILSSPLLPGFSGSLAQVFGEPKHRGY